MGKYFTIEELCRSNTTDAKGIDNTPNNAQKERLKDLIENVLDPLREAYGKPIVVNSGFRCQELNKAVRGALSSEHLCTRSAAADITGGSKEENKKLFELAQQLKLPFRQLIDEKDFSWVHISYNKNDIKRQVLKL